MKKKRVLVIDIGGTSVKLMISRQERRKFASGPRLTPRQLIPKVKETAEGWSYDVISIGFPAPVKNGRIAGDPKHLGKGWVGYNFTKALGKPTRVMNDAAMQALGSYRGGRMLFLGLGTGLGSTLVWEKNVLPLELGDLPYEGGIIEEVLGKPGLALLGKKGLGTRSPFLHRAAQALLHRRLRHARRRQRQDPGRIAGRRRARP